MKRKLFYSLPLFGHQFTGVVYNMTQLSAKFQIYCSSLGISDTESLCLWIANGEPNYGMSEDEIITHAEGVINLLPVVSAPIDLTKY